MNPDYKDIRIFSFPYAGGNKYAYNNFLPHIPDGLKLVQLEPPGRGARTREPLLRDLVAMATDLFEQVRHRLDTPYVFYGHSMGSWLAYLVTHMIREHQLPMPEHLFFTGSGNPSYYRPKVLKHLLDQDAFFQHLVELGGITPEVHADKSLLKYFEPVIRADFEAVERYQHQSNPMLHIPMTVMIGNREKNIDETAAAAWKEETMNDFELIVFEGHHFFINHHLQEIIQRISDKTLQAI